MTMTSNVEGPPNLKPLHFVFDKVWTWNDIKDTWTPRLQAAAKLPIRHLPQLDPHKAKCVIVGAAPSLAQNVDKIKEFTKDPTTLVMSVNASHDWLIERSIIPNIHVIFEWDLETISTALGGKPHPNVVYYICSHCSPVIFDELKDHTRVLFHIYLPLEKYQNLIAELFPGEFMITSGYCTLFRSMTIATVLGFRDFELFGVDSSFEDTSHVAGYNTADKEEKIEIWGGNEATNDFKKYLTQGGLAYQACEFLNFCAVNQSALSLRVHGDGLLRHLHKTSYPEQYK